MEYCLIFPIGCWKCIFFCCALLLIPATHFMGALSIEERSAGWTHAMKQLIESVLLRSSVCSGLRLPCVSHLRRPAFPVLRKRCGQMVCNAPIMALHRAKHRMRRDRAGLIRSGSMLSRSWSIRSSWVRPDSTRQQRCKFTGRALDGYKKKLTSTAQSWSLIGDLVTRKDRSCLPPLSENTSHPR